MASSSPRRLAAVLLLGAALLLAAGERANHCIYHTQNHGLAVGRGPARAAAWRAELMANARAVRADRRRCRQMLRSLASLRGVVSNCVLITPLLLHPNHARSPSIHTQAPAPPLPRARARWPRRRPAPAAPSRAPACSRPTSSAASAAAPARRSRRRTRRWGGCMLRQRLRPRRLPRGRQNVQQNAAAVVLITPARLLSTQHLHPPSFSQHNTTQHNTTQHNTTRTKDAAREGRTDALIKAATTYNAGRTNREVRGDAVTDGVQAAIGAGEAGGAARAAQSGVALWSSAGGALKGSSGVRAGFASAETQSAIQVRWGWGGQGGGLDGKTRLPASYPPQHHLNNSRPQYINTHDTISHPPRPTTTPSPGRARQPQRRVQGDGDGRRARQRASVAVEHGQLGLMIVTPCWRAPARFAN